MLLASDNRSPITQLLRQIEAGDSGAKDRLLEIAYDELRALALNVMRRERPGHTLQPTALVHEAFIKLMREEALDHVPSRASLMGIVANAMRQVLVDHARRRKAFKRGGDRGRVPLDEAIDALEGKNGFDLVALDDALQHLEVNNRRRAEFVTLRFFGGMEVKEVAKQLGVSATTVKNDWRFARLWLRRRLNEAC